MALTESQQKLKRGDAAPNFALQGVDGQTHSLSDFQGPPAGEAGKEGLLVVFMCNHCPYVKAKIGAIVELQKKWGDKVAFVGINSNDPEYEGEGMENMKAFAKERNISFPYLLDETQEVARAYGATCTPDPFLFTLSPSTALGVNSVEGFDKDFKLVFHGRIDDALEPGQEVKERTMDQNIGRMLAGEEIGDELKSSMGCSIKWIES